MSRLGRRAARRRQGQWLLAALLALVTLAVAGGVAAWVLTRPAAPDPVTMCPAGGPTGQVVLLVDTTDPFGFTQSQAVLATLRQRVLERVPEGALLSVFVLGEDVQADARPILELCNPGSGRGRSELTANPERLQARYESRFMAPVTQLVQKLSDPHRPPARWSPIFEMLQLVAINGFRRSDVHGERRLVVVSDMLHNTPGFSMYKGAATQDFHAFADTDYARRSMADLQGVQVELLVLLNTPALQTRRQATFWEDWFERAGARLVDVRPLEG